MVNLVKLCGIWVCLFSHFALVSYNLIPAIFMVLSMDWVCKRKFFCWSFSTRGAWPEGCTIPLQERPLLSSDVRHVLYVFRAVATYARSWSLRLSVNLYTAISRKVIGKSARDNPERYCGWFVLSSLVLQWSLKKWHERGHGRIFASAKEK